MALRRLAILNDFPEERWPSMALCGEMLERELKENHAERIEAHGLTPAFRTRFQKLPQLGGSAFARNADRLWNRMRVYPAWLRRQARDFDFFHVVDHSYAHLVHVLPDGRAGVFCHDLDTFRCLLEPEREPRPAWFRAMARKILEGMRKAAVVFHTTDEVRRQIVEKGVIDPLRLVKAPLGAAPEFTGDPQGRDPAEEVLSVLKGAPYLLHVGSTIPRKRVDVLIDVFCALRRTHKDLRLVRVGSAWTGEQRVRLEAGGGADGVHEFHGLDRGTLAGIYRRAALVLLPSEAEGFGLPAIEALACGAPVLASDLAVFRETGGPAATFAPPGNVPAWIEAADALLNEPAQAPPREARLKQAARFSWRAHADIVLEAYMHLLEE